MLLLEKCCVTRMATDILVTCDTDETFVEIIKKERLFKETLTNKNESWERIILISSSGRKTTFYPSKLELMPKPKPMVHHSNILIIPEAEIISEIMKYPNPSSLVRMSDDKGIFTNSHVRKSSGTDPNNWVGAKMSSYWIDDELERYKRILLKEKEVSNFKYAAYFFTGETANFTVDAKLVNFNGDLCRWVRVLQCDLIS